MTLLTGVALQPAGGGNADIVTANNGSGDLTVLSGK
jgi:hypothetical protein